MTGRSVEIRQGETWAWELLLTNASGVAIDLTGATVTGAVRSRPGEDKAATITCAITDAAGGKIACCIPDEATALIAAASSYAKTKLYYFDVRIELTSGVAFYADVGTVSVIGGVQYE